MGATEINVSPNTQQTLGSCQYELGQEQLYDELPQNENQNFPSRPVFARRVAEFCKVNTRSAAFFFGILPKDDGSNGGVALLSSVTQGEGGRQEMDRRCRSG